MGIILHSCLEHGTVSLAHGRSHGGVMRESFFENPPLSPPLHARRDHGNRVDPAGLDCSVPADFLKALLPEQLASPGYVFDAGEPVIVLALSLAEWRPRNA